MIRTADFYCLLSLNKSLKWDWERISASLGGEQVGNGDHFEEQRVSRILPQLFNFHYYSFLGTYPNLRDILAVH